MASSNMNTANLPKDLENAKAFKVGQKVIVLGKYKAVVEVPWQQGELSRRPRGDLGWV